MSGVDEPTVVMSPPFDDDVDDVDDEHELPDRPEPASLSVLDTLRAQRKRIAETRTFDVSVPGYSDRLVLRLGPITGAQQAKIIDRTTRVGSHATNASFLIAAFREVLVRAKASEPLQLLVDEEGDAVGLDRRLATMLDLGPVESARDVLEALFALANSPTLAIDSAANEWGEWARAASDEVDESFAGE